MHSIYTEKALAVSTGEALALTGAILGHANPRSKAIYAQVQNVRPNVQPPSHQKNRRRLCRKGSQREATKSAAVGRRAAETDSELIRMGGFDGLSFLREQDILSGRRDRLPRDLGGGADLCHEH
jgi:hypothetical protein